ncbi:MAG: tetratricopeptide repeat protein [Bryobacteraceae bacterium]|nr:tetratricopeptide repeat protein [Solibacteraceae bacterium]MCO5351758.1 tetratricopeptide repeat protein [Bryobacteraceae bacterium]
MSSSGAAPGRIGIWAAAGVLLLGAGGWFAWQRSRPADAGADVIRLGAAPFTNLTGEAEWDWAGAVLPAAAVRQGQGLPRLRAFFAGNANEAAALGATHVLEGYLTGGADGVKVHYTLRAGPGTLLGRGVVPMRVEDAEAAGVALAQAAGKLLQREGSWLPVGMKQAGAWKEAGAALMSADPAERVRHWRTAAGLEPDCGWCWEELAGLTARTEGREAALAVLAEQKESGAPLPEISTARLRLLSASLTGEAGARREALERLAVLTPGDPEVLAPLAEALVQASRFAEAVELYERAYRMDPGRSELLNSIGYALAWAGRFDDALGWMKRYAAAAPNSPNPADSRGEVLMMAGRFAEAEEAFLASYEASPRFNGGAALEKAALVRWLAGDAQAAGVHLEKYLKQRVEDRDSLAGLRRARWQYVMGQTTEALANLRQMAGRAESPASSLAWSSLSLYALQGGRREEAANFAAQARQTARDALSIHAATVATVLGGAEAPKDVRNPGSAALWEALRLTFRGDMPAAETGWREALKLASPEQAPFVREMLAQVLVSRGEGQAAAELVRAGWPLLTPDQAILFDFLVYPNLLCVRGAAAAEASDGDQARRYYEQFLRFTGARPDPLGLVERARAAVRL